MAFHLKCACGQDITEHNNSAAQGVTCPACGQWVTIEEPIVATIVPTLPPVAQTGQDLRHNPPEPATAGGVAAGCLLHGVAKFAFAGVIFLVFAPVLAVIMRPWDDVKYHLMNPAVTEFKDGSSIAHNQNVRAKGMIDVNSLYVESWGIFTVKHEFFFQLEGQTQSRAFFCVREGDLHQRMCDIIGEDGDEETLAPFLADPIEIQGRAHQSDAGFMDHFITCAERDEISFEYYIEDYLHSDVEAGTFWMVVSDDTPSVEHFFDSNGGVFAVGLGLGIMVVGGLFYLSRQNKKTRSENPPADSAPLS